MVLLPCGYQFWPVFVGRWIHEIFKWTDDHFVTHPIDTVFAVQKLYDSILRVAYGRIIRHMNGFQRFYKAPLNVTGG